MAVANRDDENVSILLGDGDGTFTPADPATIPVGAVPGFIAVGFSNADSNLDMAVANERDVAVVFILLGDGDGTFTRAPDVGVGLQPVYIAVGFSNAGSNLDMAVANEDDDDVYILLGDGDGTFTPANPATILVGNAPNSIAVGFFDADSNLDMAVANEDDDDVSILLGNGDGTFTAAANDVPVGDRPLSIAVGTFN
jgi:FG-GAP-like repeat